MINIIDLFAGCGGLTEGFKQTGLYNTIACVEWDKLPCDTLRNRFKTKWGYTDVNKRVIRFDIQRVKELLNGWDDPLYGKSDGLDAIVNEHGGNVDLIIGGPPCQAYSIAGRIRDKNGMRNDYRNYLFDNYIEIVKHYTPRAFLFENVPGILSAMPGDGRTKIIDVIKEKFSEAGYAIMNTPEDTVIDFSEYGIPQNRKRIIILGLNKKFFASKTKELLTRFYKIDMPQYRVKYKSTVREAIGDLPGLYPLEVPVKENGKRYSHSFPIYNNIYNHKARFNNKREIELFRLLAADIDSKRMAFVSTEKLKQLYTSLTGRTSNIHKYHVLRWDEPSNTIPAHLYKDGLRHIHPDPEQARSITVREAARLQTFPDDFEFISGTAMDFKMIGNAVPPKFSNIIARILSDFFDLKRRPQEKYD